jgi:hypothetical protein
LRETHKRVSFGDGMRLEIPVPIQNYTGEREVYGLLINDHTIVGGLSVRDYTKEREININP